VLVGSKNWAALWLVLVDVGIVEVVEVVEGVAEVEDVTSGSTNPGVTQIVVVTSTVSNSVTQSVVTTTAVWTASLLLCLAAC
jgi:hypothetical protein